MTVLVWLARRITFSAAAAAGSLLAAGALAGLLSAYLCHAGSGANLDTSGLPVGVVCESALTFGVTNFLTIVVVVTFLALSRGWPQVEPPGLPPQERGPESPSGIVLTIVLTTLPAAAIWSLAPAVGLVRANPGAWADPVGGFVLMAPLHQLVTISVLAVLDVATLLLFLARIRIFQRASVSVAIVSLEIGRAHV